MGTSAADLRLLEFEELDILAKRLLLLLFKKDARLK